MKTRTNDTDRTTPESMRQELAFYTGAAKKRYEEAQAKMIADLQTNPASAITWLAQDMVKAQTEYEVWLRIEQETAKHDPRDVVKANLEEVRYRVRSFFGSNSTSIFSNAVERARAEEYLRQAEQLESLAKHFGI